MITQLFALLGYLVHLYVWAIILAALFSMLAAFNVIDTRNRFVWAIGDFLTRLTEPALRPIRRILPNFGAIDLSPWVAVLVLQFLVEPAILRIQIALSTGNWQALAF